MIAFDTNRTTTVTTLSCDGTTKVYVKREESINSVTKMDVAVNIAERTVSFDGAPLTSTTLMLAPFILGARV
jgi:hypothetical protein